jgi:hypothetical protein
MKTTEQIAKDCDCDYKLLLDVMEDNFQCDRPLEKELSDMIGALYRRIEKLEEEKECHIAEINALESAVAGNAERIVNLEEDVASFVKDMKLQSYRLAELETWADENQGI